MLRCVENRLRKYWLKQHIHTSNAIMGLTTSHPASYPQESVSASTSEEQSSQPQTPQGTTYIFKNDTILGTVSSIEEAEEACQTIRQRMLMKLSSQFGTTHYQWVQDMQCDDDTVCYVLLSRHKFSFLACERMEGNVGYVTLGPYEEEPLEESAVSSSDDSEEDSIELDSSMELEEDDDDEDTKKNN